LNPPKEPVRSIGGKMAGRERLPKGLTHKRTQQARAIYAHPDIVERVKAQARENEGIPARTVMINEIRYQLVDDRRRVDYRP